ncbi:LOW QUALITY PROTEIN: disrupted in schizophrenia 1 protein [Centrocercus urophasianus]|uniref:LOW QUALITY PROTEIN: disrupted in schizophrenia 1 protein n=1 Tax=Centrocercus urophasianus TaxID=9002 RepID=UPI001C64CF49|nr:LOW QUALITY PROTEIN: disrupted in schizophrenia 1 protein [Centrocercus urophasianus]
MWRPQPRSGGTDRRRRDGGSGKEAAGPDGLEHLIPSGSLRKKKLAKRPGYMRPEAQRQLQFQSLGACKSFSPEEFKHDKRHCEQLEDFSLCREQKNNVEFLCCSSIASSAVVLADGVTALGTTVNMPGSCENFSCSKNPWSENIASIYPAETTSKVVSVVSDTRQTNCGTEVGEPLKIHVLDQAEVNNNCEYQNRDVVSCSGGPRDSFRSSFSFIQLSLNSASGVSDAELKTSVLHPSSARDLQEPGEATKTQEHSGALCCFSRLSEDLKPEIENTVNDKLQDCETFSLSDTDATLSYSTDSSDVASAGSSVTSGYESSFTVSDQNWDTLIKRYEPALLDCQLGNWSTIKVKSMILRIQRLQQKAIEADDYDRAEKYRRKLEELEKEKHSLKFQLPSRHPSISSFLDRFVTQIQAVLCWAADGHGNEETQLWHENRHKLLRSTYQERIQVLAMKRNDLLQEKKCLQKEIEDLRVRLSVLEEKDQQLQREIEEQDRLIQPQDCELTTLLGCVSLRELQEISKAVDDTLASSYQIPFSLDLPGTIKSLQEKEQSLSVSIKETTAKVCTSQKLCSTLRKKVNDIETQLPALLEAKMLAVSGSNFGTAKDLTEEIRSLTSEKKELEGLLSELLVLSARNIRKLERIKDDYNKLKQELERGETAFATSIKENAEKYMEMLEDKLHGCGSQLLQRVWEADLEACQLLIRGFQLKETSCCGFEEAENQMDELEMTASGPSNSEKREEDHFPKGTEWNNVSCPGHSKLKQVVEDISFGAEGHLSEEFFIFSAELGEKCEAISEKLVHLEDQLQSSVCRVDEGIIQSLQREIQVVKETLQTVLLQLQPAREAGDEKAGTSSVTAGVQESRTQRNNEQKELVG